MDLPVGLRMFSCYNFPSGKMEGSYEIIVKDLAYEKKITVFGDCKTGEDWEGKLAGFKEFVITDELERWEATENRKINEFVIKYEVDNQDFWDNNAYENYKVPKDNGFFVILGKEYPVALGCASFVNSILRLHIAVQNMCYCKDVGIVYSQDNWKSYDLIKAEYSWSMASGVEVWSLSKKLASSSPVEFAISCQMDGQEYWDNNFYKNYLVKPQSIILQKAGAADVKDDIWEKSSEKTSTHKSKKAMEPQVASKATVKETELQPAS